MEGQLAVSISEAARRIGVSERTTRNLIRTKQLLSRRIGRRRVVPVASLEAFLRKDHLVIPKGGADAQAA